MSGIEDLMEKMLTEGRPSQATETKYRVVGCDAGCSSVSWHSTVETAIEHALTFEQAAVYRSTGLLVSRHFRRWRHGQR